MTKFSPELTAEICVHLENGLSRDDVCDLMCIARSTFYEWLKESEFSDAIKQAEAKCKKRCIDMIRTAGITTWQACAWWLERKHASEYALKHLIGGAGGEPIKINNTIDLSKLTTEDLKKLAELTDAVQSRTTGSDKPTSES